jgi:hypothetical protein
VVDACYLYGIFSRHKLPAVFEQTLIAAHKGACFKQQLVAIPTRGNHTRAVKDHDFHRIASDDQIAGYGEIAVRIDLPGGDADAWLGVFDGVDAEARGGEEAEVALAADQLPDAGEIGARGQ